MEVGCAPHLSPHVDGEVVCTLRGPKKIGGEPTLLAEAVSKLFTKGIELAKADSSLKAPPTVFVGERCWSRKDEVADSTKKRDGPSPGCPRPYYERRRCRCSSWREESPLSGVRENVRKAGRCVELPLPRRRPAQSWDCVVFLAPTVSRSFYRRGATPTEETPHPFHKM